MGLALLSSITQEVMPYLPGGAPEVVVNREISKAAVRFCDQTRYWQDYITPVNTVAGTAEYPILQPAGQIVVNIEDIQGPRYEVAPKTESEMDGLYPTWRTTTGGTPEAYIMINPQIMRIYPIPTSIMQLNIKASLKPSRTGLHIDATLMNDYYATIAAGALYKLLMMPNQVWSNAKLALNYKQDFDDGVIAAKLERAKGFSRSPIRTMPAGASGRNRRSRLRI